MVNEKVLRERKIKAARKSACPHVSGQLRISADAIMRHWRLVVRTLDGFGDTDQEGRHVIEEERIEVIAVEHEERVRGDGVEVARHLGVEPRHL
jgi:hypothetical protein